MGQPMGETGVAMLDVSARPIDTATDRADPEPAAAAAGHRRRRPRRHRRWPPCSPPSAARASALFDPTADINDVAQSVGLWIVAGWMLANVVVGTYARAHVGVGTIEYARVCSAAGITAGAIGIISYLTKFNLSRGFFVLLFVIGVPLLLLWRWIARRLVHRAHARGHLLTRGAHLRLGLAHRRGRRGARPRVVARLPHRRRAACRRRRRPRPPPRAGCRSSASAPRRTATPCGARRPTSSSSPRAPSRRRSTSGGSPGTSRATTCRWPSCRASATSPRAA